MYKLVMIRHGESEWNKLNLFTGWTDVELSDKGVMEAHRAGKTLKEEGYDFDIVFTSMLKRAIHTMNNVLFELDREWLPVIKTWRLNERHYGALQGLNKKETAEKYGDEQVHLWRRSADVRPPELEDDDPRFPSHDDKYKDLDYKDLPHTECLLDTVERVIPYWKSDIEPALKDNKKVIVVAHGNSLRGLIKYLDNLSDEEIVKLEIETGNPICYELDDNLKPIKHYYIDEAK